MPRAAEIKGATKAERALARTAVTRQRRAAEFKNRIRSAGSAKDVLWHATAYARAVGDDLTEQGKRDLAQAIVALADERNQS